MQIKTFRSFHEEHKKLYEDILNLTYSINDTYPQHSTWFKEKFLPDLKNKKRIYIVAQDKNGKLAGCILLKNTEEEKKICTLFVHPDYRKQGVGRKLVEQTLLELGEHPLITVSDRNIAQLMPLLKKKGFHLSAVKKGVYRPEDTEYYFNDQRADIIKNGLIPVLIHRMNQMNQR
ncbi:MAG: GNAT family N-acetyltransferase [Alphaproteobacteria bacterium]|nr:GNAT family N-acetyltransferase [Alphaproteobacteria bacterium]